MTKSREGVFEVAGSGHTRGRVLSLLLFFCGALIHFASFLCSVYTGELEQQRRRTSGRGLCGRTGVERGTLL